MGLVLASLAAFYIQHLEGATACEVGVDFPGTDINSCGDKPGSAQACSNLCKKTKKCNGFTYGEKALGGWFGGRCCLKSRIDGKKNKAMHVSGLKGCVVPRRVVSGAACEVDYDYQGGDLTYVTLGSAQACSNECLKRGIACYGFTYGLKNAGSWAHRKCFLKSGGWNRRPSDKKGKHVSGTPGCVVPKSAKPVRRRPQDRCGYVFKTDRSNPETYCRKNKKSAAFFFYNHRNCDMRKNICSWQHCADICRAKKGCRAWGYKGANWDLDPRLRGTGLW